MSTIDDGGPAIKITMKCGGTAIVSPDDSSLIQDHQWRLGTNGYVYMVGARQAGRQCLLHRIITGAKPGEDVHHLNEDKTDCRRENLRVLSASEHQQHHKHVVSARNRASRIYSIDATCKMCGIKFTKHPDHRGRQTCCSKRCAVLAAVAARKAMAAYKIADAMLAARKEKP